MKRIILISVVVGIVATVTVYAICSFLGYIKLSIWTNRHSHIDSASYPTISEKVIELRKHWPRIKSPVEGIVFKLDITENTFGPSGCNHRIAVKVEHRYIDQWVQYYQYFGPDKDVDLKTDFHNLTVPWALHSTPEYYATNAAYALVFREEGVILFRGYE